MAEPALTTDRGNRNPTKEETLLTGTTIAGDRSMVAGDNLLITGTVITGDIGGDVHIHEAAVMKVSPPPEAVTMRSSSSTSMSPWSGMRAKMNASWPS